MLNKLKIAARAAFATLKASIWSILLLMLPYADDIMAMLDQYMPMLATYLPANIYKAMGMAIVGMKFAIQIYKFGQKLRTAPIPSMDS